MTRVPKPAARDVTDTVSVTDSGPFETERQVRELPSVVAVYDAFDAAPGPGRMSPHCHRMLCSALAEAGVELGGYDHRIVMWLAGWGPETCAVVAGLIARAGDRP